MAQQHRVLVLDKNRQPLVPSHLARARELLQGGKAAVFRKYPFTIILKERERRTKYNRIQQGYPKAHWLDAACVDILGKCVFAPAGLVPVQIYAKGHGLRQMCRVDKYGFIRTKAKTRAKRIKGF